MLTALSTFWFDSLDVPNHLLSIAVEDIELELDPELRESLRGRSMLVRKARVVPFECVVRGYLSGSGWKEYRATGSVCGIRLPGGSGRERPHRADLHPRDQGRDGSR